MPGRRAWVFLGAAALTVAVVAGVVAWPHLQRYVGLAPPRQIDRPIATTLPDGSRARVLGIAHNAGNNPATLREAVRNEADAVEVDVITARGRLVAEREYQPWPGLARQLFRGPSLEDAWDSAAGVGLLKLDLKQSDPAFLDQVVAFLSPRAGSRAVMVSSPDRAALMWLPAEPAGESAPVGCKWSPSGEECAASDPVTAKKGAPRAMTVATGQPRRVTASSRTVLYGVLTLAALSVIGAIISVAGDLSPSLLDAMGPEGRLSIPLPMTVAQVVMAVAAGSPRRTVALIGSGFVAAALLLGVISGFFDGGYSDHRLTALERVYQVSFVLALTVVGVLAAVRFLQALRSTTVALSE